MRPLLHFLSFIFHSSGARRVLLQLYRASIIAALALLVHLHYQRVQIDNNSPVKLSEIQTFFPDATKLVPDTERMGIRIFDAKNKPLGFAVRTMPICSDIKGYSGPTDTMIVFDEARTVRGIGLRYSGDTLLHFRDVQKDRYFVNWWKGKSWDELAGMDLKKAGVEGVSGATLTSLCVARGIVFRLKHYNDELSAKADPPPVSRSWQDFGLFAALLGALAIAFTRLRGFIFLRAMWQIVLIGGVGFLNGQLLSVALFGGWASAGVAWRSAPALALLAGAALLVPWVSKKALYCQYFCPHGAAQEWVHRLAPRRFRVNLPSSIAAGLRWLPWFLLLAAIAITIFALPVDLAELEPFDAYLWRIAGWATISIAVAGLIAALFVPMAYCKFGCPTGAILEFIRARGPQDRFGFREIVALGLVAMTLWMYLDYERIRIWMG